jgi:hypothetical protein
LNTEKKEREKEKEKEKEKEAKVDSKIPKVPSRRNSIAVVPTPRSLPSAKDSHHPPTMTPVGKSKSSIHNEPP